MNSFIFSSEAEPAAPPIEDAEQGSVAPHTLTPVPDQGQSVLPALGEPFSALVPTDIHSLIRPVLVTTEDSPSESLSAVTLLQPVLSISDGPNSTSIPEVNQTVLSNLLSTSVPVNQTHLRTVLSPSEKASSTTIPAAFLQSVQSTSEEPRLSTSESVTVINHLTTSDGQNPSPVPPVNEIFPAVVSTSEEPSSTSVFVQEQRLLQSVLSASEEPSCAIVPATNQVNSSLIQSRLSSVLSAASVAAASKIELRPVLSSSYVSPVIPVPVDNQSLLRSVLPTNEILPAIVLTSEEIPSTSVSVVKETLLRPVLLTSEDPSSATVPTGNQANTTLSQSRLSSVLLTPEEPSIPVPAPNHIELRRVPSSSDEQPSTSTVTPPNRSYCSTFSCDTLLELLNQSEGGKIILQATETGELPEPLQLELAEVVAVYHLSHRQRLRTEDLETYALAICTLFKKEKEVLYIYINLYFK